MLRIPLTLVLLFAGLSRWGSVPCAAVAAPAPTQRHEWTAGQDPDQVHLLRDGKQIGTFVKSESRYYPYDGATWGPSTTPPIRPPSSAAPTATSAEENYGIDREKWAQEPRRSIGARGLPDDTDRLRLTVIGPEKERRTVLTDLDADPALKAVRDRVVVQGYAPDAWPVARAGFKTDGLPTIYLQSPSGKVLHRQDTYEGGAEQLAEAIRKADPAYDPRKDPNLTRKKSDPFLSWPNDWPTWVWVVVGIAAFWLLRGLTVRLAALPNAFFGRLADEVARRTPPRPEGRS